jgi:hypothetical protein
MLFRTMRYTGIIYPLHQTVHFYINQSSYPLSLAQVHTMECSKIYIEIRGRAEIGVRARVE